VINDQEKGHVRATKLVIAIKQLNLKQRLQRLNSPTLRFRRTCIRSDMIQVYNPLVADFEKFY